MVIIAFITSSTIVRIILLAFFVLIPVVVLVINSSFFDWWRKKKEAKRKAEEEKKKADEERKSWLDYLLNYWHIALIIWEILHRNPRYEVIKPVEPVYLKSQNCMPKNLDEFDYVFVRKPGNNPNGTPVLNHEIRQYLGDDLLRCGFNRFNVICTDDTEHYYVKVKKLNGFKLGVPMSTKLGELRVTPYSDPETNQPALDPETNQHINFEIFYYYGGRSGAIKDNTVITIYHEGLFIKVMTTRDKNNNPDLKGKPVEKLDYIASIIP
jgi:hypothetical protein